MEVITKHSLQVKSYLYVYVNVYVYVYLYRLLCHDAHHQARTAGERIPVDVLTVVSVFVLLFLRIRIRLLVLVRVLILVRILLRHPHAAVAEGGRLHFCISYTHTCG